MADRIVIASLGACTPVGRGAWASAAAVRAGISGFAQHPHMIDSTGEPMRAAIAPWLDIGLRGAERLEALLIPALDEALEPLAAHRGSAANLALALGLPGARPGLPADIRDSMLSRVDARYRHVFRAAASFVAGHASGLIAVQAAAARLAQGGLDGCIVAGVDSYIDPVTLEWLEADDRMHGAGPLNNAWGFIPGEAGSALLLVRESVARSLGLPMLAVILGTGASTEHKRIGTETVCIGEGLTQALRETLASLPGDARVTDVYCDMNGEPYRADEFGLAVLRVKERFESASDFIAPADCWGDVAAAGGPLHLALAAVAGVKGYGRGPFALAWASSEGGERAATLIATTGSE